MALNMVIHGFQKFQFWSIFWTYFFNSTYTRVDLYASIYGSRQSSVALKAPTTKIRRALRGENLKTSDHRSISSVPSSSNRDSTLANFVVLPAVMGYLGGRGIERFGAVRQRSSRCVPIERSWAQEGRSSPKSKRRDRGWRRTQVRG